MFRMLIVEDNTVYRDILTETLRVHFPSAEISEAANGTHALRTIEAVPPDLIFMDIKLPGQSGLEVSKAVRASHPDVVIVILTSHDLPEYREAAKKIEVRHFLSKSSTTTDDIVGLVESLLSERGLDVTGAGPA